MIVLEMETINCFICELPFDVKHEEIVHVKKRGCRNLKKASERRGDGKFTFLELEVDTVDITVHKNCWRNYINDKSIKAAENRMRKSINLSAKNDVLIKIQGETGGEPVLYDVLLHVERKNPEFDYANLCLFCGEDASEKFSFQQLKKPAHERKKVNFISKTLLSKIMLLATVWGEEILERVNDKDLVSLNARFHNPCYTEYLSAIPNNESLTNAKNAISLKKFQHNLKKELLGKDSEMMENSKVEQKEEFDYETHCIICAKDASEAFISKMKKNPEKKRIKVSYITRPETAKKLLQLTYKSNETFREEVRSRVKDQDLVALKARYHIHCYLQFNYVKRGTPKGRPRDVNTQFKIEIEDTQPTSWDEYYQDYIVNEDVEFNFQTQCIICGRNVSEAEPEEAGNTIRIIQRHDTGENLLYASFRFTDKWREQVRDRVKDKDLVALGARYHKSCFPQFFMPPPKTKKQIVCIADSNVSDYLRVDQEEQNAFSDVFDDLSLDNEHDSYYDLPSIENDQLVQKRENTKFASRNNSFECREDNSEQLVKKQTELQPEKKITVNVMKNPSTVISIKKSALLNEQKLRDYHIIFNDENKTVNTELSNDLTDFNKYCHEIVEQQNTTDGEKGSLESVWDCDDTNEDHEETQDNRNLTEDEAISLDNFHIDEEYYENNYKKKFKNQNRKNAKERKEVSWCSQVCNTCLTPGRKLYRLVRYAQIFNTITGNNDTIKIYVCGECLNELRKIQLFKDKAVKAKKILDEIRQFKEIKEIDDETTLMKQTSTSANKLKNDNENSNEDYYSDWINDNQVNDEETDLENISYPTTSGVEQTCAMTSNVTATKQNNANKQIRSEEASDFDLSSDEASDSDLEPPTKKHKSRDKDSDYVPSDVEKETKSPKIKKNEHKKAQCKVTYTGINLKGVVKKVKIDPEDAKTWIEKERNCVFFRNLENKCVLCVSQLRPHESLKQHLATFHNNALSTHVCSVCKIVFKTTENLNDHLEEHFFLLRCDVCGYLCYGKHNMKDHLSGHKRSIECLECGALFGYATEFYAHYKEHFKCNECGKNMLSKEKLKIHVERRHAIHQCDECAKTYRDYNKLQQHKRLKHTIERYEECYCVSCDKQFSNTHHFKRHLLNSVAHAHERTESQTVTCPECNRVLSSKHTLKQHYMSFHSQEKRPTFPCSKCGKQFASRKHVNIHIKYIHNRVEIPRNKVCQYCSRAFKTKRELIHHIRTHTGEKPYQCPLCDAAFAQKTPMQTHMRKRHKLEQSSILTPPTGTTS